jgi:hypothetical protein
MGFSFIFGRLEMSLLEACMYTRGGLEDGWRQRQLGGERREQRVLLTLTVAMVALTAAMMAEGWDEAAEGSTDATRLGSGCHGPHILDYTEC